MSEIKVKEAKFGISLGNSIYVKSRAEDRWYVGIVGSSEKTKLSVTLCFSREFVATHDFFEAQFNKKQIKKLIRDLTNVVADLEEEEETSSQDRTNKFFS